MPRLELGRERELPHRTAIKAVQATPNRMTINTRFGGKKVTATKIGEIRMLG
jgi:hypothetical protein